MIMLSVCGLQSLRGPCQGLLMQQVIKGHCILIRVRCLIHVDLSKFILALEATPAVHCWKVKALSFIQNMDCCHQ